MAQYIIRRILVFIPMLFVLTIIVFALMKAAPGDPFSRMLDPELDPSVLDQRREAEGMNNPLPVQYITWLGNAVQGDFGESLRYVGRDVSDLIISRLPNTINLALFSLAITLIVAIPIGIYSARNPYSPLDYFATGFGFFGLAIPNFFFGLVAIYFFAVKLGWFPSQGYSTTSAEGFFAVFWDRIHHLILPGLTLGLASTASYMRYMRSEVLNVLGSDYIRTAKAKGMTERNVLYKHTLRNALIPIITLFGFEIGVLVSGAIITEGVFTFPGIGMLLLESISTRDYPVIMAITLMLGVFILIGNLLADIFYSIVDPRIRYD